MSAYLHGGGVPFVADKSIAEIDKDLRRRAREAPAEFVFSAVSGGPAMRTAQIAVRVSPDGARAQRQDAALFLMLGSGTAPPPIEGDPRFYLRIVPEAKTGAQPSETSLKALADAMAKRPPPAAVSGIPAAYTYFGQFLAHDISWMKRPETYDREVNFRTSALDLDSLFGPNAGGAVAAGTNLCSGGLALGKTNGGGFDDLPRAANGFPALPDPRNDNNLAVAQMTVAIIKFHMRVCQLLPDLSPAEQQTVTARHIQAVTLYDYLPRIIHPDVYRDVKENGRCVIFEGKEAPEFFQVPLEFAAACFRFGHAMVRETYDWSPFEQAAAGYDIRTKTYPISIGAPGDLNQKWVVDWPRLLDTGVTAASRFAHPIGCRIASDLRNLDKEWIEQEAIDWLDYPYSLGQLTLFRGRSLGLASAEELWSAVAEGGRCPPPDFVDETDMFASVADDANLRGGTMKDLRKTTPLWFYTLREAEKFGGGGRHLGPLASRVVMETLHAAIQTARGGILNGEHFVPLPETIEAGFGHPTLAGVIAAGAKICPDT